MEEEEEGRVRGGGKRKREGRGRRGGERGGGIVRGNCGRGGGGGRMKGGREGKRGEIGKDFSRTTSDPCRAAVAAPVTALCEPLAAAAMLIRSGQLWQGNTVISCSGLQGGGGETPQLENPRD